MSTVINSTLGGNTLSVAQLAILHPSALSVFTRHNIDYCCGGHRSFEDACHRIGLDPEMIKEEIINATAKETEQTIHPENWNSDFLIDYIIQNHHLYVRKAIPEIQMLLDKVCDAHGNDCLELLQIREAFLDLADDLSSHMNKEEIILFPAIKRLASQNNEDHPLALTLRAPMQAMEHEHTAAGDLIKQIRTLSNNYTPPDFACPTFKITYKRLQEFDNDLMRHIHLENNILFERIK